MRWMLVLVMLLAGCPRTGTVAETSGTATAPADDRSADLGSTASERKDLLGRVERRLALARTDGASPEEIAALEETKALLETLEGVASSSRAPRDKERDALAALSAWLDDRVRAEARAPRPVDAPPDPGPWGRALEAYAAGDLELAVEEGIDALRQLVEAGIDSATLRYRLAEWALEQGDDELAAELFDGAAAVEDGQGWIAEDAPLQAQRARTAALGPDRAALAEAELLWEQDRYTEAWELVIRVIEDGEDGAVRDEARELLARVRGDAEQVALRMLARAEQVLEGPGPYDEVVALLDEVATLPADTWDRSEHLRLQGWLRNRTGAVTDAERVAQEKQQEALLGDARELVVAGEYRAALKTYGKLDGTPLQSTARREAAEAAETLVREERDRAGEMFVAARKLRDPEEKRTALLEVKGILTGLLREFPESEYADRLAQYLATVEQELSRI